MQSIHLALLAVAAAMFVVAAGPGLASVRTRSGRQVRRIAAIVGGALVVGNAVSLLPGTPAWYSFGLLALTAAGGLWGLWAAVAASSTRRRRRVTVLARPTARRVTAVSAGPQPTTAPTLHAVPEDLSEPVDAEVIDAEVIDVEHVDGKYVDTQYIDAEPTARVYSVIREYDRASVTRQDLLSLGPAGGERTVGQGTYVAAHLDDYLGPGRRPRSHTRAVASRTHGPTPEQRLRRMRVRRAYDLDTPRRTSGLAL